MTIRILLLILFCSSVFVSESNGQRLVKELKESIPTSWKLKLKGNVKHVTSRHYSRVYKKMKFDLSLLDYYQKSGYSNTDAYFDTNRNITRLENEYSVTRINTNEIMTGNAKYEWEYNNGQLISCTYSDSDTSFQINLIYSFDDKDRIIEIKQEHNHKSEYQVEEIEHLEEEKKSNIFSIKDSIKKKTYEYFYDLNDNLLNRKKFVNSSNQYYVTEYYYDNDSRLECMIFNQALSKNNEYYGTYTLYYYNKKGVLEKIKSYKLIGDNVNGEDEYWKGAVQYTTRYKEKERGAYILQKVKSKRKGNLSKTSALNILDKNRNIILKYYPYPKIGGITIYDITYY